jgi:phosphoribosylformylglycinamidine synthase subunit PurL
VTDNLNFGSPEKPIGYWQLANACKGLSEACSAFNTPVTGGNVSLYNETFDAAGNPVPIYPTPVVGMVGIVNDITQVCGQGWQNTSDRIYLLGESTGFTERQSAFTESQSAFTESQSAFTERSRSERTLTLGASEYLAVLHQTVAGQPPTVNFDLELKVQAACRHGIHQGWIKSAHDSAEGGLTVALAECCISGNKGAAIKIDTSANRWDEVLFGEGGARIIVSISPAHQAEFEAYLEQKVTNAWQYLGVVGTADDHFQVTADITIIDLDVAAITETWATAIERRLEV